MSHHDFVVINRSMRVSDDESSTSLWAQRYSSPAYWYSRSGSAQNWSAIVTTSARKVGFASGFQAARCNLRRGVVAMPRNGN